MCMISEENDRVENLLYLLGECNRCGRQFRANSAKLWPRAIYGNPTLMTIVISSCICRRWCCGVDRWTVWLSICQFTLFFGASPFSFPSLFPWLGMIFFVLYMRE
jgi:hypothetical protein